ncbi:MAG TPA: glutathione S-transferase family protein [Kofleriaceae bacterium]|nr:glutathione S-transferase family protein [Kofleriaceae bacterium]
MSLVLYIGNKRYSSWSLRPYLALAHAGARFETRTILLDQPSTAEEIAKVNPAGRVPVLHAPDGLVIWDSLAICEWANEVYPQAQLWPADRAQRARARSLAAEMHSGFTALRGAMPMDLWSSLPGVGHSEAALADARRIQGIWREQLAASGGPFLFGAFTIADAMYAPVTTRFTTYGVELDAVCRGYVDAIAALPAFVAWKHDAKSEPAK